MATFTTLNGLIREMTVSAQEIEFWRVCVYPSKRDIIHDDFIEFALGYKDRLVSADRGRVMQHSDPGTVLRGAEGSCDGEGGMVEFDFESERELREFFRKLRQNFHPINVDIYIMARIKVPLEDRWRAAGI